MLELIVFLCGAIVMILEMVGSRVIAPYIGTSLVAWTGLIGIILASLSLGYWWGGQLADRRPHIRVLGRILVLTSICIAFVAVFNVLTPRHWGHASLPVWMTVIVYNAILFGPASFLLGMVSPYAIRLRMIRVDEAGRTAGRLYALSTVGSILGTFVAGFFLIAVMGSTMILIGLAILLVILAFLASTEDKTIKIAALAFIAFISYGVVSESAQQKEIGLYDQDTVYNRILISSHPHEGGRSRSVVTMATAPTGIQSAMYTDDKLDLVLNYTRFLRVVEFLRPDMQRVLILGGGGYSFPQYLLERYPQIQVDVVELDPGITALARRFFALHDRPGLAIYHEDGRTFLNRDHAKYDVVIIDAFGSHHSIPFHLTTLESVRRINALLNDNGVVIMNTITGIQGNRGKFLRAEYLTYRAIFPHISVFPIQSPEDLSALQNVIIIASHRPQIFPEETPYPDLDERLIHRLVSLPIEKDDFILTDDYAPVDNFMLWLQ